MVALKEARITGVKLPMVYSIITTSMAKITPASGVLKEAPMAAAIPQATRVRILLLGRWSHLPAIPPEAAPKWTLGPSLPTEWPLAMLSAAPKNCITALRNGR